MGSSGISIQKEHHGVKEQRALTDVGDIDSDIGCGRDACSDGVQQGLLDIVREACNGQVWHSKGNTDDRNGFCCGGRGGIWGKRLQTTSQLQ